MKKKRTKGLEISSFYIRVPKIMIKWCTVLEIWWMTDVIVIYHFGLFFALLSPWQPQKSKFWKNEKNTWRYDHFTYVYQKLWSDNVQFLRYAARQMDRQTDGKADSGCPISKVNRSRLSPNWKSCYCKSSYFGQFWSILWNNF